MRSRERRPDSEEMKKMRMTGKTKEGEKQKYSEKIRENLEKLGDIVKNLVKNKRTKGK